MPSPSSRSRAHPSSRVPLDQLLRLQEQVHGRVEVRELREGFGLGNRPREAVEDESLLGIFLFQAAFCHRNDEFVRHEFSGVHVCLRLLPDLGHTRRPVFRLISSSGSKNRFTAASRSVSFERASAWAIVRGKPSRMNPFWASFSFRRRSVIAMTSSSGTSFPESMYAFAFFPISGTPVVPCSA